MNWPQHTQQQYGDPHGAQAAAFDPYAAQQMTAADLATDEKLAFLRRTYGWLMVALAFGAAIATGSFWFFTNNFDMIGVVTQPFMWLGIIVVSFLVTAFVVGRLLMNPQTASWGLFLYAAVQGVIFGPLLAIAYVVAGAQTGAIEATATGAVTGGSFQIIWQALILTGIVFSGLSAYVYLTKQDFSFLRGALVVGSMVFLGVILVHIIGMGLGWDAVGGYWLSLGIASFGILLASGFILYDTSKILHSFTGAPGEEKVAAFMLLSDLALLLWYILYLLIQLYARE